MVFISLPGLPLPSFSIYAFSLCLFYFFSALVLIMDSEHKAPGSREIGYKDKKS